MGGSGRMGRTGATEKAAYGLPPLAFLRAVMDAKGTTREQLASRSGLSQPTVSRALGGEGRVRLSTAEKVAKVVGVPVAALHDETAYAETLGRLKLPPVVAGRDYGYPDLAVPGTGGGEPEGRGEALAEGLAGGPVGAAPPTGPRDRQYVIVHRDEWRALHEALGTISGRLEAIEEAVGELATRPIAEFDVTIKERGQK